MIKNINDMEKQLKAIHPELELFKCDYNNGEITNVIIRFPSENNLSLMQKLFQSGWKAEREEILGTNNETGIKGWVRSRTGRKYLRMSGDIDCFFDLIESEGEPINDAG